MTTLRRHWLQATLGAALGASLGRTAVAAPEPLQFPRDAGAHPDYRIEWWYITGYTIDPQGQAQLGFQVTFFRSKVPATQTMRSSLAARQLYFAHAAVTDVRAGKLLHDQRMARSSGALGQPNPADRAWASQDDTDIRLGNWSLQQRGDQLDAKIGANGFSMELSLTATQPVLLQGLQGTSQKGPDAGTHTSYYYSLPQLRVDGEIRVQGQRHIVTQGSKAWLDHEWSNQFMPPHAVGWDWIGINLFDGSALTAFRLRDAQGSPVWAGGSWRDPAGLRIFEHSQVHFLPQRQWHSTASGARYPMQWQVQTPAGRFRVEALVENQELDSRASTGSIYWEGLCDVWDASQRLVGRGYLEMTGYAAPLRL